MKIGIIGPSKVKDKSKILEVAKIIANSGNEIIVVADKGSSSEYFAQEYLRAGGKKVYDMIPLDDKEFGYGHLNTKLGERINCGTWRNQPEKLNEETDMLVCVGYAVGVLMEIGYSKWFKPKPVYIIKEFVSGELPKEINKSLDLRYISISQLEKKLK